MKVLSEGVVDIYEHKNASDADAYYASVNGNYGRTRDEWREKSCNMEEKSKISENTGRIIIGKSGMKKNYKINYYSKRMQG